MLIKAAKESCSDAGLLIIRAALGLFFLFHGAQKLFGVFDGMGLGAYAGLINQLQLPLPQYTAVAIASIEFFGGLALILGLWSRCAASFLAVTLAAAGFFVYRGVAEVQVGQVTYPANLAYLLIGLGFTLAGLALTGPGRFSVPTLFAIKRVVIPTPKIPARETPPREIPTRVAT
jgi:putative oxidoreductase